ncbi:hypothetical protein Tco_0085603 [Tanacetum coccineum]
MFGRQSIPETNWQKLGGIRGRSGNQKSRRTRNNKRHRRTIQDPKENKHEAKSQEMHFWGGIGHVPRIHDVQRLNGKLASLNIFLAKSAEEPLPFFKTLKKCTKKSDFQWTTEAKAVFKQMKKQIAELPTLTAPMEKEELIVYLAVAREAPIKQVLSKPEIIGRLQKWSIEMGEYDIHYRSRVSIKGQILANFIVEWPEDDSLAIPMEVEEELPEPWTLFTDGSSCIDGSEAGLILTNPEGT